VVGGKLRVLDPIGRHHFVPLPVQHFEEVGRPRASDPVGRCSVRRISGTSGKVHDHWDAELFGQQNSLSAHFAVVLRAILVRMQRVSMTTQGADLGTVIGQDLMKLRERSGIFEHRELAVGVAHVISGAQFDGINVERRELLENHG
jgi:hypothetical protein